MKTYKQILAGLVSLVLVLIGIFVFSPRQASAVDAGSKFWGECVDRVLNTGSGNRCASIDNESTQYFTYGSYGRSFIVGATYQGSNTANDSTRPSKINILVNNQLIGDINYSVLVYASGPLSTGSGQQYYAYRPLGGSSGPFNYRFLIKAEPNSNNTYQVLALVYNELQEPSKGPSGDGYVWAWRINKATILSSSTGAPVDPGPIVTTEQASCRSSFSFGFEWLICPIIDMLDKAAEFFNGFVMDQLNICTGQSLTTGQPCTDNNILSTGVKKAWTVFSYIATSLLVVIMLVMVISQALSVGPFDAYTVRRILPRIVAAAILIQISYVAAHWFIDVSNDLGQGIQALMYAPFGGESAMTLDSILGKEFEGSNKGTEGLLFFGVLAGLGAAVVNLPGLVMLALFVVISLFVAFFVLLLRQMLIIMLVILVPIALIAWILPGTERYWKTWTTNFSKLLLMFPLIMALIAAGRIFAKVVSETTGGTMFSPGLAVVHLGPLPVPTIALVNTFAGLAIIIVAFFAPYFLLPKTFGWGGQLMGAVGAAVAARRITRGVQEKSKPYTDRLQGNLANRYRLTTPADASRGRRFGAFLQRGAIRTASGHGPPTRRSTRDLLKQGADYRQELIAAEEYRIRTGYNEVQTKTGSVEEGKKWTLEQAASGDKNRKRAAYNFLMDTSSFLELDNPELRRLKSGPDKGIDIQDTQEWMDALNASPERFAKVNQARPDWVTFRRPLGGGPNPEAKDSTGNYTYPGTTEQREAQATDDRMLKVLQNVNSVGDLTRVHNTFFNDIDRAAAGGYTKSGQELTRMIEEAASTSEGRFQIAPLRGGEMSGRQAINQTMEKLGKQVIDEHGNGYLETLLGVKVTGGPSGGTGPSTGGAGPSTPPSGAGPGPATGGSTGAGPSTGPAGGPRFAADSAGVTEDREAPGPTTAPRTSAGAGVPFGGSFPTADEIGESVARHQRQQQGGRTIVTESGVETRIEHEPRVIRPQPGESVTQGGVIIPPGVRSIETPPSADSTPPGPGEDETPR